jgi:hypothetical protein
MIQFKPTQQAEALVLLERMAWGDMDYHILDMKTTLRRALEATRDDWVRWDRELRSAFETDGYRSKGRNQGGLLANGMRPYHDYT